MRRRRTITITLASLLLGIPASAAASGPVERIVERHHKTEVIEAVTDDVCGDVGGGLGLRSGVFRMVETGHTTITIFEDRFQVIDVETGTFSYDFDDPSIPDVSGYRYTSPFKAVVNKNDNVLITQNLHEQLPGHPDGITVSERWHLTWKDDAPFVERYFFKVTGCP